MDGYRFTHESDEEDDGAWSTPEEERTFRRIRDLLMEMHGRGCGIYVLPVKEGMPASGLGSEETYGFDGWAVGEFTPEGGHVLAVGPWLDQVVEAARGASR